MHELSALLIYIYIQPGASNSNSKMQERNTTTQWLFLVPLKGGIGSIFHPPGSAIYKWYISGIFPANWGMDYAIYHLLGEPETTIYLQL